jgi:hypothetical protein
MGEISRRRTGPQAQERDVRENGPSGAAKEAVGKRARFKAPEKLREEQRAGYERAGLGDKVKPVRWALREPLQAIEKVIGKGNGGGFDQLARGYTELMAPELVSSRARRADAYMAKNRAAITEARNQIYKQSAEAEKAWDKATDDERRQFLYDHETGRWSKEDPAHARYQALYDATYKREHEALGGDPERGYKENYLPHIWEQPEKVQAYFRSPAMVKKYGPNWFNKASTFKLIQEGERAGFKLKTNNPETMLQNPLMAGTDMIARMQLLRDMQRDGLATPARAFTMDKRIEKTQQRLADVRQKYAAAMKKVNDPRQQRWKFADPAVRKYTENLKERGIRLKAQLEQQNAEKAGYEMPQERMDDLKANSFRIIGPDDKVWNIHRDGAPLWKNVMDNRGLWENQGLAGSAYRGWQALRNTWVPMKLGLSLFHPLHVATIHIATGLAAAAENLLQGRKLGDGVKDIGRSLLDAFALRHIGNAVTGKGLRDHPAIEAWNTAPEKRTPQQQQIVDTMKEGGFVPTMSARDLIRGKEKWQAALDNLFSPASLYRVPIAGVQRIMQTISAPVFEHWIPALKTDAYLTRAANAIRRDPSLVNDAGRRGEVLRQIAKDTDRTYGEMNYDTLFWNKALRDGFTASFLSGGWKLAQLYYARGLLAPAKLAYEAVKNGKVDAKQASYNMLFSYIYGGMGLALGAYMTKMLGGQVSSLADMVFPQTGEKDKDGKPIRVSLPFFNREFFSLGNQVGLHGLLGGAGAFVYDQTLYKGIADTLTNQDYFGRALISNPSKVEQWAHLAWDTLKPITLESYDQAAERGSKFGQKSSLAGINLAPKYVNNTRFEQAVQNAYFKLHPSTDDSLTASLKGELRAAAANGDEKAIDDARAKLSKQGLTPRQINLVTRTYPQPFVVHAWKELPAAEQKRIIEFATPEEKAKFRVKPQAVQMSD